MARVVVLPSLSDVLLFQDDDAACAFNEETQRNLLMRSPEPLPTPEERLSRRCSLRRSPRRWASGGAIVATCCSPWTS